jgi:hypothetical protein
VAKVKYIYSGAPQCVTLRETDAKGKDIETEVVLRPGKEAVLDSESPYVKSLIARGHLKPVTDKTAHNVSVTAQPSSEPDTHKSKGGK